MILFIYKIQHSLAELIVNGIQHSLLTAQGSEKIVDT